MSDNDRLTVHQGKSDRRKSTSQRILWTSKELPVCVEGPENRRVDEDTLRVLRHMEAKTRSRDVDGMVMAVIKRDGTLEVVITGAAFDHEFVATGATGCIQSVISDSHLGDVVEE